MWETAVIPKLLYNSEVWTDIKKVTLEKLENLQNEFLRAVLATPRSTPTHSLCWETGTSSMENRIIVSKLLFYHHLLNLDEDSLASQVDSIQMKHGYPGLMSECGRLVTELSLPNIGKGCLSKLQWKKLVKERIFPLTPMGVLAHRLRTLDRLLVHPISMSGNFLAYVSAESPSNISPNPSEVISEVSEP